MKEAPKDPAIIWDIGTGYDLFASLYIIHRAVEFGLRPSWAAGVRCRLSADVREMFAQVIKYIALPLHWVHRLPEPKDSAAVLRQLEAMPVEEILPELALDPIWEDSINPIYLRVLEKRSWDDRDLTGLSSFYRKHGWRPPKRDFTDWLDWWTRPADFGRRFRRGLQEYYEGFFREEERRIRPFLEAGLSKAQGLAEKLSGAELVTALIHIQGYKTDFLLEQEELVLVPSFWAAPIRFYSLVKERQGIFQFEARPPNASLVPGAAVPDALSLPLQALSDNTRLRILSLLAEQPLTQSEMAKKLRLRAPTINHHLKILVFASLIDPVHIENGEKRYQVRPGSLEQTWRYLEDFLGKNTPGVS